MICGIDEAGRGPVIGPLVIVAVYIPEPAMDMLKIIKPRDSKTYTKKSRETIATKLMNAVRYIPRIISAEELNTKMNTHTLNEIELTEFVSLIYEIHPKMVYVDAVDVNPERFKNRLLSKVDFDVNIVAEHKADSKYPIVSCASIIAKVIRDKEISMIEKKIGMPIGSGYPSDKTTRNFLKHWIEKYHTLPPHVRTHWKTVNDMLS